MDMVYPQCPGPASRTPRTGKRMAAGQPSSNSMALRAGPEGARAAPVSQTTEIIPPSTASRWPLT